MRVRLQHVLTHLQTPGVGPIVPLAAVNPAALGQPADLPPLTGASLKAGEFPRSGGSPAEHAGTAVFRGDRLVGTITVDETAALLALRGEMGKVYNSLPDPLAPGHLLTLRIHQENIPQVRTAFVGGRPVVTVHMQVEGEILGAPAEADYTAPANKVKLEQDVAQRMQDEQFAPLIAKVYRQWGADPVGFGLLFRPRFVTVDDRPTVL